ncbi:MAG: hypothetical protein WBY93_08080 [Candidatus Binatus sp.]
MGSKKLDDDAVLKFARGFERYAFGPKFVLESDSWLEAEQKVNDFLKRRNARSEEPSPYFEAGKTFWREYQFLFLCQTIEFKLTEVIEHLRVAGKLKAEFLATLRQNPKVDPERAKSDRRLVSPASLLEDFGYGLGGLVQIIEKEALPFEGKDSLLAELKALNKDRVKFIHHSFGGRDSAGTDIARAFQAGKLLLKRLEGFKV